MQVSMPQRVWQAITGEISCHSLQLWLGPTQPHQLVNPESGDSPIDASQGIYLRVEPIKPAIGTAQPHKLIKVPNTRTLRSMNAYAS